MEPHQIDVKKEMSDIIYDTLMENKHFPQLKLKNISKEWCIFTEGQGNITFEYFLDETFINEETTNIEPAELLQVEITIKVSPIKEKHWKDMTESEHWKAYYKALESGFVKDTFSGFSKSMYNSTFDMRTFEPIEIA